MSVPAPHEAAPWATVAALTVAKRGHTDAECEDAVAHRAEAGEVRIAVADGATESAHARTWAQLLVDAMVEEGPEPFEQQLRCARAQLQTQLDARQTAVPWYVTQKVEQGAHAAVLALRIARGGTWQAQAVGDVVLFHLNGSALSAAWPLSAASAFSTRPALVSSVAGAEPCVQMTAGRWRPGDALLVVTDALAAWLLRHTAGIAPFVSGEPDVWRALIAAAHDGGMTNDDVALVRVTLADGSVADGPLVGHGG